MLKHQDNRIMKIAKGYRLRPETHELIRKVKEKVNGDLDKAISTACKSYLEEPDNFINFKRIPTNEKPF